MNLFFGLAWMADCRTPQPHKKCEGGGTVNFTWEKINSAEKRKIHENSSANFGQHLILGLLLLPRNVFGDDNNFPSTECQDRKSLECIQKPEQNAAKSDHRKTVPRATARRQLRAERTAFFTRMHSDYLYVLRS